jgi:branched-chain amino acid transport system substrate-binding protein
MAAFPSPLSLDFAPASAYCLEKRMSFGIGLSQAALSYLARPLEELTLKAVLPPRLNLWVAAVFAALAVGGTPAIAADAPAPFVIPGVLPLTGPVAFLGTTIVSTLKLVEAKVNAEGGINGRPVHFDIHDDQSSPQVAVQMTTQLLAEKPSTIFGSTVAGLCAAMEPLFKSGPVQYCLSPAIHPAAGSYIFSASFSTHEQYSAMLRYLRERKLTRIATISTIDATGQDGDAEIAANLKDPANAALQIVDAQHFTGGDPSVAAQMAHIKAAHPDALMVSTTGVQLGTVFRALIDAGLEIPVTSGSGNISVPLLTQLGSVLPKELLFAGSQFLVGPGKPSDPTYKPILAYTNAINAAHINNDLFSALGWDPAFLLVDAYRKLGTNATADQIRDWLESQRRYAGVSGTYNFSKPGAVQRGLSSDDVQMVRWMPATKSWAFASMKG